MNRLILLLCFFSFTLIAADDQPFQLLDQLVGHCWQAKFPDGKKTDTHCFTEVYGGAFVKDQHVVCGEGKPYCAETWYDFDEQTKQINYRYDNSFGGVSDGSVQLQDNQIVFPDEVYENKGQKMIYRSTWSLAEDQYISDMWQQDPNDKEVWEPVWKMIFTSIDLAQQNIAHFNHKHQLHCHP